jgi:hypothetical protein
VKVGEGAIARVHGDLWGRASGQLPLLGSKYRPRNLLIPKGATKIPNAGLSLAGGGSFNAARGSCVSSSGLKDPEGAQKISSSGSFNPVFAQASTRSGI